MTAKKSGPKPKDRKDPKGRKDPKDRKAAPKKPARSTKKAPKAKRSSNAAFRSDAIDQLVGAYFKRPVEVHWDGSLADTFQGRFQEASISLAGVATAWLPIERLSLSAREARIVAGLPGRLEVSGPCLEVVVSQADIDPWMQSFELPFSLHLEEQGLLMKAEIAGFQLGEIQTQLEIVRGWFVLRPRRAALLGVPAYVSSLFRTYLPVPPITDQTKLAGIEHEAGRLRLRFAVDDFEEELTPGLLERLRKRVLPFGL
jgi:hypothetical protein